MRISGDATKTIEESLTQWSKENLTDKVFAPEFEAKVQEETTRLEDEGYRVNISRYEKPMNRANAFPQMGSGRSSGKISTRRKEYNDVVIPQRRSGSFGRYTDRKTGHYYEISTDGQKKTARIDIYEGDGPRILLA